MTMHEAREWRFVDKRSWGDGPWVAEPDKLQWIDEATGLDCLIVRNPVGALCGYVGVPDGHPAFEREYDDVDVSVHGGLTFSDHCHEADPPAASTRRARGLGVLPGVDLTEWRICHVPIPGRPDRVWWLGFDCAHGGDREPGLGVSGLWPDERYRDVAYVQAECRDLARQLAEMGKRDAPTTE